MGKKEVPEHYTIEAVPGEYGGIEFRSQLEIKWAKFLDSLAIPWLYEESVPGLVGYLPDFCIPIGYHAYTWLEIKPANWDGFPVAPLAWKFKAQRLHAVTGEQVVMAFGEPKMGLTFIMWDQENAGDYTFDVTTYGPRDELDSLLRGQ